jgi:hypothetical protein
MVVMALMLLLLLPYLLKLISLAKSGMGSPSSHEAVAALVA